LSEQGFTMFAVSALRWPQESRFDAEKLGEEMTAAWNGGTNNTEALYGTELTSDTTDSEIVPPPHPVSSCRIVEHSYNKRPRT
jgi:hypothetical protein